MPPFPDAGTHWRFAGGHQSDMSDRAPKLEDSDASKDVKLFGSDSSDASWWNEASLVADAVEERMGLSPSTELAAAPPDSTLACESSALDPIESPAPSIESAALLGSTLACESPFTNLVHTSTITNFSSAARDIVPIISLGQKTDAILDRLGLEDRVILDLRDLVGNVRSSKWSAALTSPEWGLSSDAAGDLCDALMEDLVIIDKAVSLFLYFLVHIHMSYNLQEPQKKTNLSNRSLFAEYGATAHREVIFRFSPPQERG